VTGPRQASRGEAGFNLFEVTLALFVLSVGLVSILAVFPAAFALQRDMVMDSRGSVVAESAAAFLAGQDNPDFPEGAAAYVLGQGGAMASADYLVYPNPAGGPEPLQVHAGAAGADPLVDGEPVPPPVSEMAAGAGADARFYWRALLSRPSDEPEGVAATVRKCRVDVWFVADPGSPDSAITRVACYHSAIRAR
jgi:hypothetical protein